MYVFKQPRLLRVIVLATLVFVFVPSSLALAEDGDGTPDSIGIRIVDSPPTLSGDPRAGIYIIDHVDPGTSFERRIEVSTTADSPMPVELYAAAAEVEEGAFAGAEDRTPNYLSTWMSITPSSIDIPADGVAMAVVNIDVPTDAAPGEQYAVVWVEARSPVDAQGGVALVSRVGIRVYLSVGPGGPPAADFVIESLTTERSTTGIPIVTATVRNTGGRALDLSGALTLRNGPGGLKAGPFPAQLGITLGIGETAPVKIELDSRLPSGPWDAELTLASGLDERTIFDVITFPGTPQGLPFEAEQSMPAWIVPAVSVFIAVLIASIAVLGWVVVRRRRTLTPQRQIS
jgi:hypothetical protein